MARERKIVTLVDGYTLAADVGILLGLSRERIRQIYKRATGHGVPSRSGRVLIDKETRRVRRFWVRARPDSAGCWLWTGSANSVTGYGSYAGPVGDGYAHRAAYAMVKGPIPKGLTIDHLCRVKLCVNPAHLEAVTQRENILRSPIAIAAINARKTHCLHGHSLDDAYRSVGTNGQTHRRCRPCAAEQWRVSYLRRKAAVA